MSSKTTENSEKKQIRGIVFGFSASLALLVASYATVQIHLNTEHQTPSDNLLLVLILGFAVVQLIVQLFYFLHVWSDEKPKLKLITSSFAIMVVSMVVFGSLWIMKNLNKNMEPTEKSSDSYIIKDELIEK